MKILKRHFKYGMIEYTELRDIAEKSGEEQ